MTQPPPRPNPHWRDDPRYEQTKTEALRLLRHAIEQAEKDQHLNATYAATEALLHLQRCYGLIRHSPGRDGT